MLVGIGTDGASANIAAAGLKGLVEKSSLVVLELVFSALCRIGCEGCSEGHIF